jgi:hypothetical protein
MKTKQIKSLKVSLVKSVKFSNHLLQLLRLHKLNWNDTTEQKNILRTEKKIRQINLTLLY